MSPSPLSLRLPAPRVRSRRSRLEHFAVQLADGARTTVHVATFDRAAFTPRIVVLDEPRPLVSWCREERVRDAIVGGFFARPQYTPLGEVRRDGAPCASIPFDAPWGARRACLAIDAGEITIARRDVLGPSPSGDLLQAGPLLVAAGRSEIAALEDPEGFSAGARQFDSDITAGRYPRAALGLDGTRVIALACDGRTHRDAGMTLAELADTLVSLGAQSAINLDGGGSASLVYHGRLRNRPREEHGVDLLGGRPIVTAVVLEEHDRRAR